MWTFTHPHISMHCLYKKICANTSHIFFKYDKYIKYMEKLKLYFFWHPRAQHSFPVPACPSMTAKSTDALCPKQRRIIYGHRAESADALSPETKAHRLLTHKLISHPPQASRSSLDLHASMRLEKEGVFYKYPLWKWQKFVSQMSFHFWCPIVPISQWFSHEEFLSLFSNKTLHTVTELYSCIIFLVDFWYIKILLSPQQPPGAFQSHICGNA